jgi:uncharacterized protein (DUF885 family)
MIQLRSLLLLLLLAPLTRATFAQAPSESVADRSAELTRLFHEMWEDELKHSPEFASSIGDLRYNDQLSDLSPRAINAQLERNRGFLLRLAQIDTTGLSDQEKLSAQLMTRSLIEDEEGSRFKTWQMPVNQFHGIHTDLPGLVDSIPFDTVKEYDDYIARLHAMPTQIRQTIENMMAGIDEHRTQPAYLLQMVLDQTTGIAEKKPADSPFALPLKKFPKTISAEDRKRISDAVLAAIQDDVNPAYVRFGKFLSAQAIPVGRKDPGAWSLPDGDDYYAFAVRQNTTLNKTPAEIHQIGLDEVKRDEAAMLVIATKLGFSDLKSFAAALKTNPRLHPTSGEALIDDYRHYETQMAPRLPELFGRLPKAKLEVVEMPRYIQQGQTSAWYAQGTADGSRPGRVNINTYDFANRSLAPVESIAYHEGIPGHHLQISIAQEATGLPEFRKYLGYTAFVEGWALYAEQLGKDIGLYQDPYSDYGRLESDIWRAIRLVVDTGVHSQHWTRQQMVDYFHDHSTIDEPVVQAEVDRYIAWPGQALGYKMGQLKILELRAKAKAALGDRFNIKAFHDEVVDSGALPLDVLDQRVTAWIAAQLGVQSAAPKTAK